MQGWKCRYIMSACCSLAGRIEDIAPNLVKTAAALMAGPMSTPNALARNLRRAARRICWWSEVKLMQNRAAKVQLDVAG